MAYYAHSNELDRAHWQLLSIHLENTASLALGMGEDAGLSEFAYLAGLLHDIGKYSDAFQGKLEGAHSRRVDHSTAGAKEVLRLFRENRNQELMAIMLAYCIAGHHSGLPDYGSPIDVQDQGTLQSRLKKSVEDYTGFSKEINTAKLILPARLSIKHNKECPGFSLAFFTRMVYSTLVDADFLETETFMNGGMKPRGGYASIQALQQKFSHFLEQFEHPVRPIDQKRTETLKACMEKAAERPGFFTLTVPTGGGKTFASMAFALQHAVTHGSKRVIYVIPYTSIIEQNAAEFKRCLGEDNVLEHHSNFDWEHMKSANQGDAPDDRTNNAYEKLKLATENWDIPIVVTTNVQFFESLFANRSSRCRKLHNLARSVIIFDEAQMLPRAYIKPCIYAVYELVRNYGASAVFCTATQPAVQRFLPPEAEVQELAPDPQALFNFYKRVRVENLGVVPDADLCERINQQAQVLCIVNTRKHAKGLFEEITPEGRFHLSTLMCPAHRKETIATIKQNLQQGKTCRVVSTQIMEAGIDIDFPIGYRAVSGLDSILQAAGRVNREGKNDRGNLHVFEPDSPHVKRTPAYIEQGAEVARSILRDYSQDPTAIEAIEAYFELLYNLQDRRAFDAREILAHFNKGVQELSFDFKTAADKFKLIDENTAAVVIMYNPEAVNLLHKAQHHPFPTALARALQVYTVNIYEREYQALLGMGLIDVYGGAYAVLNDPGYYNTETGLVIPERSEGEAIFFDG